MGALYMGNKVGREGGVEWRAGCILAHLIAVLNPSSLPPSLPSLPPPLKVVFKGDSKVAVVMEQCIRLLHTCGLPREDLDFICGEGGMMEALLLKAGPRMTQFT
jgi:1-pyrroline-5-carboxylate dehydrogenase